MNKCFETIPAFVIKTYVPMQNATSFEVNAIKTNNCSYRQMFESGNVAEDCILLIMNYYIQASK